MRLMRGLAITSICLWLHGVAAEAQTVSSKIIGGDFARLDNTAVALILFVSDGSVGRCSGILVGPREVLTAAHCVTSRTGSVKSNFNVIVGGAAYTVEQKFFNGSYDPNGAVRAIAPYDLGILILSSQVTGTSPVSVLRNYPVSKGTRLAMFGYGSNEISGLPNRNPWEDAKSGVMVVSDTSGGLISSTHLLTSASPCPGDSGGPAIHLVGGNLSVVGTVSMGINNYSAGTCFLSGDGSFSYVNLQSPTSQHFMSFFPGISFFSGANIFVNSTSLVIANELALVSKARTKRSFDKRVRSPLVSLRDSLPYAEGTRGVLVKAAMTHLQTAIKARSLTTAVKAAKKAQKNVQNIIALGVN